MIEYFKSLMFLFSTNKISEFKVEDDIPPRKEKNKPQNQQTNKQKFLKFPFSKDNCVKCSLTFWSNRITAHINS